MINNNTLIFYDFETGSRNPNKTQPIQLAAVAIHPRKLTIIPNSEFEAMIFAEQEEEKCIALGVEALEDEALSVNKKTREDVAAAPKLKNVWEQFVSYADNYNYKKNRWSAPILCGFNIIGFDNIILNRIAGPHGYNLGPWDDSREECSLFHPLHCIDLFPMVFTWFENTTDPKRLNMDTLRDFFSIKKDNAHDALQDCIDGAELLCKFLKLQREVCQQVKWN